MLKPVPILYVEAYSIHSQISKPAPLLSLTEVIQGSVIVPPLQNIIACVVYLLYPTVGLRRHHQFTPIIGALHWLPIRKRLYCSLATLTYKALAFSAFIHLHNYAMRSYDKHIILTINTFHNGSSLVLFCCLEHLEEPSDHSSFITI